MQYSFSFTGSFVSITTLGLSSGISDITEACLPICSDPLTSVPSLLFIPIKLELAINFISLPAGSVFV